MKSLPLFLSIIAAIGLASPTMAAPPEISHIYPDFQTFSNFQAPHILTGEGFDRAEIQVWTWEPPGGEEVILASAEKAGDHDSLLPEKPPEGARRVTSLDVEQQIITARLGGSVIWVGNSEGFSRPCMINVAKPFWLGDEQVEAGGIMHLFGFGVRGHIAMRQGDKVLFPRLVRERDPAAPLTLDNRLIYFEVAADTEPGDYEVLVHNGVGGEFGWRSAGQLTVKERNLEEPTIFPVREFGAVGDGATDDTEAVQKAVEKAAVEGGIVHFAPGAYRVRETIVVPAGVTLRGSGRDLTAIEGFGYDPAIERRVWWSDTNVAPAVVVLNSNTNMEKLTISGYPAHGVGGTGLVELAPDPETGSVERVWIEDCRLLFIEEHPRFRTHLHWAAFNAGSQSSRIHLMNNEFTGTVSLRPRTTRSEIVGNRFSGGHSAGGSLYAPAFDSLLDRNLFTDGPSRVLFYARRNCYVRYNEVHGRFRDSWSNTPEAYLIHGGSSKVVGTPSSVTANSLTDDSQTWRPGEYRDATVLITAGRGFGQYRRVTDNTAKSLTIEHPWLVEPDQDSEYMVGNIHTDSAYFSNLNDSSGLFMLYNDCIGIVVERQREESSGGVSIWGRDYSKIGPEGELLEAERFQPSWYNMVISSWLEGSALRFKYGAQEQNPYRGPVLFANYVVRNQIRRPDEEKSVSPTTYRLPGQYRYAGSDKGAIVIAESLPREEEIGRIGTWHTVVSGNLIQAANIGVAVQTRAHKTFILDNNFDQVTYPIIDRGEATLIEGNFLRITDGEGDVVEELPDVTDTTEGNASTSSGQPSRYAPGEERGWMAAYSGLQPFIAAQAYTGVEDESLLLACQENLRRLYDLLVAYDQEHGALPEALFFLLEPEQDRERSLEVMLGCEGEAFIACPTAPEMIRRNSFGYLWNEPLGGKSLSDIPDPDKTWLLMDFVAAHQWMVEQRFCGHSGGVNVLFADGSVRKVSPLVWSDWSP